MQNYSFLQQQLHHLILGHSFIKKSLFEFEKILFYKQTDIQNHQHVFITGLPRAGTTILLEYLYQTQEFASLTYNDMPFILSPNLFSKLPKKQNTRLKERMHRDGILFGLHSPEAFDDVFFQTFSNGEIKENLEVFIFLILRKYRKQRYLSKNNNNFKRIQLIQSILPNARFIIPFRSPLQHANSLLSQHRHFCDIHKKDKFILQYMNYLGHFEFGLNHQSYYSPIEFANPFSLNYWLEQWYLFYKNQISKFSTNTSVIFISYEDLCKNKDTKNKLTTKINLNNAKDDFLFKLSHKNITETYDDNLLNKCKELEAELL